MKTCKDCTHYTVCERVEGFIRNITDGSFKNTYTPCELFTRAADVVPTRYGYWVNHADKYDRGLALTCSECGRGACSFVGGSEDWWAHSTPAYCPNCGAMMAEEVSE